MQENATKVQVAAQTVFPLFVVIGIIGFGIWPVMYLSMREKSINKALGAELIPHWLTVTQIALLCTTLGLHFLGTAAGSDDITALSTITGLAMSAMWIVFAFRAKQVLEDVIALQWKLPHYRLNSAWTFFFNLFYIVYCLNDLPHAVQRAQAADQGVRA
ncbi:hypothetical protein ACFPTO_24225 [Paraburkholderia denitrificans]|uniref:DUF4234 domain-containing protein n=1 Tax=Paraburkholderia denitrificans TaxID=694025 RepID=A0ABW0JFH2_9BURK